MIFISSPYSKIKLPIATTCFLSILFLASCGPNLPEDVATALASLPKKLDFNIHVKPILSDRCFACHGPDQANRKADLRLDQAEAAYAELPENPGKFALRPGKPAQSEVFYRILSDDPEWVMPPPESDLHLSAREKAILSRWIEQGAEYKPHWAFIKPEKRAIPEIERKQWAKNPIDHFILKKLEDNGWEPAPEADKAILLRRLSFDLTGLPPSLEEMEEFLTDDSPKAYETAVDRLLASPHYGERMATEWLDVARFADTHGYTVDRYRDMSPWRDWVIKAFNQNMPYDQFITWQLAGDLLPNANAEQILATGFNRNHQQNMEGGIVEEEFRVEYVADRTNTLGTAFLGLTMECARCHDHKYDPISQKDYYSLFSFFNNVQEAGQISWDNAMPVPTMLLSSQETEEIASFIKNQITVKEEKIVQIEQEANLDFNQWLGGSRYSNRTNQQFPNGLTAHFSFESEPITNRLDARQKGVMKQQHVKSKILPDLKEGKTGKGLQLDGDAWLDLGQIGAFERSTPFSVGIWINLPKGLSDGVIFHKGQGAALYNWRGYHLALKNDRLEMLMAHTAPYNAIIEYVEEVPRDRWIHLMITYDGSSSAAGLKIYLDGKEQPTSIEADHLYKSIGFDFEKEKKTGLQIGARWRGIGARGARVDEILVFKCKLSAPEVLQIAHPDQWLDLLKKPAENLTLEEKNNLKDYYLANFHPKRKQEILHLQTLREKYNETLDTVNEIMVMQEMERARETFILERGQYDMLGEVVFPTTPEDFLPMPEGAPPNRLGLTQWLFDPDHPLTARVAMNRLWQQFFGRGIVLSAEDFGNQGDLPTHPELLDWLAVHFLESGWDLQKMIKLIVTSATYRQSSKGRENIAVEDPENLLHAQGPSMRLTAEMLRDNALAASGLLVKKIGGPSVKPYQPDGLWRINGTSYRQDKGEKLYRRSLYTLWKRTVPHPTQSTFDAPNRDNCTVRRQKTNTPLQALVLLNDPVYLEAARVIGQKMSKMESITEGMENCFRELTGRKPSKEELQVLASLQQSELEKFKKNPDKLKGWLDIGEYSLDNTIAPALLAANTVVASTMINADATLIKR